METLLAGLGLAAGLIALILSIIATRGIAAGGRVLCRIIKAEPEKYGYDSYCDFLNDNKYSQLTGHCDRENCPPK